MYFLPVRPRLNCSAACLLFPPASRPRVHIDVHRAFSISLSLSLAILLRFRCTVAALRVYVCVSVQRAPVDVVVVLVLVVLVVRVVRVVLIVVVVVVGDFRIASSRKVRSPPPPPPAAQMADAKKAKCVSCIVHTAIAKTKVPPACLFLFLPLRWFANASFPFVLPSFPS